MTKTLRRGVVCLTQALGVACLIGVVKTNSTPPASHSNADFLFLGSALPGVRTTGRTQSAGIDTEAAEELVYQVAGSYGDVLKRAKPELESRGFAVSRSGGGFEECCRRPEWITICDVGQSHGSPLHAQTIVIRDTELPNGWQEKLQLALNRTQGRHRPE